MLNYITKRGSASANTLGVVALMYSGLGWIFCHARGGQEDELNTVAAATVTGLLYKSTAGLKKCAMGGVVGLALSGLYVAFASRDMIKDKYSGRY